jgi:hypothetical protein
VAQGAAGLQADLLAAMAELDTFERYALNPKPEIETRNLEPGTRNPKPEPRTLAPPQPG